MSVGTVHFKSLEAIVSYLEKHPKTNDQYLKHEKVIDAVAKFFADRTMDYLAIETGIELTLFDMHQKIKLPEEVMLLIRKNLVSALRDYADGKPIVERTSKL